jgi:M6 family metalloprotease-like protein
MAFLLILLLFVKHQVRVHSIVPPHPDLLLKTKWESVHEYRRRLAIDFTYTPISLNEEVCKYLNETACEEADINFEQQAKSTRSIVQSVGRLRTLVVLVQWQDHVNRTLITRENLDILWNGFGTEENIFPSGSIRRYIDINSYGKLEIQADVLDWIMTDGTESFYGDGRSGLPRPQSDEPQLRRAFSFVLEQLDDQGFDFTQYDQDNDGILDSVVFLHSGYSAERGGGDCETGTMFENRIWSHVIGRMRDNWISSTGIQLGTYEVASVYRGTCYSNIARIGVMTHEFLHTLGLPDLYDTNGRYGSGLAIGGLAGYDIMANPGGQSYRQAWPGHLSPWSKMDLGWLNPIEIQNDGTFTARASEYYEDVYIIRQGYQEREYLLIENRQPLEFDSFLWAGGILIYHVDENKRGSDRGFPGLPGWPSSGSHYKVALLQADGLYQLEKSQSNGHAQDFYLSSDQILGPGNGELVSSSEGTYPNTDSYAFGMIAVTGIVIENFHATDEHMVWSFDVRGLDAKEETISPSVSTSQPSKKPTRPPSDFPTITPSNSPTRQSATPSSLPSTTAPSASAQPSLVPSKSPSIHPTTSLRPSPTPVAHPSQTPTEVQDVDSSVTTTCWRMFVMPSMALVFVFF